MTVKYKNKKYKSTSRSPGTMMCDVKNVKTTCNAKIACTTNNMEAYWYCYELFIFQFFIFVESWVLVVYEIYFSEKTREIIIFKITTSTKLKILGKDDLQHNSNEIVKIPLPQRMAH